MDLLDLDRADDSDAYDETDRLVLRLATAITATPAEVPAELREALIDRVGRTAFVELVSAVTLENHRSRLNRALDVQAAGFSDGAVCALPAHRTPS